MRIILREVKYLKEAEKFLLKADKDTIGRIRSAVDDIRKMPPVGDIKKLHGFEHKYRIRVGKNRIIYEIVDDVIYIINIGSRGQIYKGGN